jgi:hypothetical protein
LPSGVQAGSLSAAIDGLLVTTSPLGDDGVLSIEWPADARTAPKVLELWYQTDLPRRMAGKLDLVAPQVLDAGDATRAYWQIVLPENEHLVSQPSELVADMVWRRNGLFFGRAGSLSQQELEEWTGASAQAELPRGTNVYLFSAFETPREMAVWSISRRSLLLVCSGLALVIGLGLIYLPLARHTVLLLAGGIAVAALGLWLPDVAILAGQAAIIGILCALIARLLIVVLRPQVRGSFALRDTSPSSVEVKSTQPHVRYEGSSHATTAAAPLALATPPTGAQP